MKHTLLALLVPCLLTTSITQATADELAPAAKYERITEKTMMEMSAESMLLMQAIAKDYLYLGTDMHSTPLNNEMRDSVMKLDKIVDRLSTFHSNDTKVTRWIQCVSLGREELKVIMADHYTVDNMKVILDLTNLISEAALDITHAVENNIVVYNSRSNALISRLSSL